MMKTEWDSCFLLESEEKSEEKHHIKQTQKKK